MDFVFDFGFRTIQIIKKEHTKLSSTCGQRFRKNHNGKTKRLKDGDLKFEFFAIIKWKNALGEIKELKTKRLIWALGMMEK